MAKKKIFLIAFAALASFSVLASNMSYTSAPSLAGEVSNGEIQVADSQPAVQKLSIATAPAVIVQNVVATPKTEAIPVPVDVVDSKALEPNEQAFIEPENETAAPIESITRAHEGETDGIVAIGGKVLESVWVDLPNVFFRNVALPVSLPPQPIVTRNATAEVIPVSVPNTSNLDHTLGSELARPVTNFIYRDNDRRLSNSTELSNSLMPSRSIVPSHSLSEQVAGLHIFESDRTPATLTVSSQTKHFETPTRNLGNDLFGDLRDNAHIGLSRSDIAENKGTANNEVVVQPLETYRTHIDFLGTSPIGFGFSLQTGSEANDYLGALAPLNQTSIISVRSEVNDRSHGLDNLKHQTSVLDDRINISGIETPLAFRWVDSVDNNSGHSAHLAGTESASLPISVREVSSSIFPSLVTFAKVSEPIKKPIEHDANTPIGFSIPILPIVDNRGSHEDVAIGNLSSSNPFSRDIVAASLYENPAPLYVEKGHKASYADSNLFAPLFDGDRSGSELFSEPLSSPSSSEHSSTSGLLAGVFVDSRTAEMFSSETDKSFVLTDVLEVSPRKSIVAKTTVVAPSETRSPLIIDGKIAMSNAMIGPMSNNSLPIIDDLPQKAEISKGGPAIDMTVALNVKDMNAAPKNSSAAMSPVLINGKTEFSADLLKPMKPAAVVSNPLGLPLTPTKAKPQQQLGYCDAGFVGDPIRFSQTVELRLEDLLSQLHSRFGINFIMGPNVGKMPINVKAGSIPWNVLLRSQLFISGIRARCIGENTIELIENSIVPTLQDGAAVSTRFLKLKFLQRTSGGTVDLANRSTGGQNGSGGGGCGGGGTSGSVAGNGTGGGGGGGGQSGETAGRQGSNRFDQLVMEIEKILGIQSRINGSGVGGGQLVEEVRSNRSVTQIPGRNILVITASEEEHAVIKEIVDRADRPPFQVVVKGLIYTANETQLKDIGVQTTITGGTADNRVNGGLFGSTLGRLGTIFDFSAIIGTFDFNVQANLFQQNGAISIKARPFATVLDGLCTRLDVGPAIPIVIDGTLGGEGSVTFVNAANNLSVTPYVVDDENGDPMAVTLEINMTANSVDNTVTTNGVPGISQRSLQTQLLLGKDKTAILGGFTVDQDRKDVIKTPGLGDIPIIGQLFKRRIRDTQINRLYFAITASVIRYGEEVAPVKVEGATTDPQTTTVDMKKRGEEAEKVNVKKNVKDH